MVVGGGQDACQLSRDAQAFNLQIFLPGLALACPDQGPRAGSDDCWIAAVTDFHGFEASA